MEKDEDAMRGGLRRATTYKRRVPDMEEQCPLLVRSHYHPRARLAVADRRVAGWLPSPEEQTGNDHLVQKMILGTQALGDPRNYLILAQVQLPLEDTEYEGDDEGPEFGSFECAEGKVPNVGFQMCAIGVSSQVQVLQQINHDGEVYCAHCMPQDPCIVTTKTNSTEAYVFYCRKHPSRPSLDGPCNPDLRLRGHTAEGYGLS